MADGPWRRVDGGDAALGRARRGVARLDLASWSPATALEGRSGGMLDQSVGCPLGQRLHDDKGRAPRTMTG